MSARLTEWFPGEVKPALPGVYQRDYRQAKNEDRIIGVAYSHWDGKQWSLFDATVIGAALSRGLSSCHLRLPWRGLAEDPSAAKGGDA